MKKKFKTSAFKVKAAGADDGLSEGQFEAYASVFGNKDSYGDIVNPGAFTRTLAEWQEKGETIPVLWGHDLNDPFSNIGAVTSAEEDENGLKVSGQLDMDNPTAQQVFRLMKGRRTNRMSFAYSVQDAEEADDGMHLKDLDLFEVSVVQIPANDQAEILAVKANADALAAEVKAGRTLSSKNETSLREARDAIDAVLKSLGDGEDDQGKASGEPSAKSDEDPGVGKSDEEPSAAPSVDDLAAQAQLLAHLGREES